MTSLRFEFTIVPRFPWRLNEPGADHSARLSQALCKASDQLGAFDRGRFGPPQLWLFCHLLRLLVALNDRCVVWRDQTVEFGEFGRFWSIPSPVNLAEDSIC